MGARWQVQEAKNRFSDVVERAIQDGPQTVTKHGKDAVVIVQWRPGNPPQRWAAICA